MCGNVFVCARHSNFLLVIWMLKLWLSREFEIHLIFLLIFGLRIFFREMPLKIFDAREMMDGNKIIFVAQPRSRWCHRSRKNFKKFKNTNNKKLLKTTLWKNKTLLLKHWVLMFKERIFTKNCEINKDKNLCWFLWFAWCLAVTFKGLTGINIEINKSHGNMYWNQEGQ